MLIVSTRYKRDNKIIIAIIIKIIMIIIIIIILIIIKFSYVIENVVRKFLNNYFTPDFSQSVVVF